MRVSCPVTSFIRKGRRPAAALAAAFVLAACANDASPEEYRRYLHRTFQNELGWNNENMIALILERGAGVDEIDSGSSSPRTLNPLILALRGNAPEIARFLIEREAKVSITDSSDRNALLWAIEREYWDIAGTLVERGSDVNIVEPGRNPLDLAAVHGAEIDFFNLLFDAGAKVSDRTLRFALSRQCRFPVIRLLLEKTRAAGFHVALDPFLQAVLLDDRHAVGQQLAGFGRKGGQAKELVQAAVPIAAALGHLDSLRAFAAFGVDLNAPDERSRTPLQTAAEYGQLEAARFLIERGADVNSSGGRPEDSPLLLAVRNNWRDLVSLLLWSKAAYRGSDVLAAAGRYADASMFEMLAGYGVPFHRLAGRPISTAFLRNKDCISICKFLIKHGFRLNEYDADGRTLLEAASTPSVNDEVYQWLLGSRADPRLFRQPYGNPANACIRSGDDRKLRTLLRYGGAADESSVWEAAWAGNLSALKILAEQGLILSRPYRGETALHAAAARGFENVLRFLLKAGLDVNARNAHGDTPLMTACRERRVEAVRALLELGADRHRRDRTGRTALDIAREGGMRLVIDCFR